MKNLIAFLFAVFGCLASHAYQATFYVNAASTNIPATFDTSAQSRVLTQLVGPVNYTVCNYTPTLVAMNNQTYDSSTPSVVTHRIPPGICVGIGFRGAPNLFFSGEGSVINSGILHGWVD